MKQLNTDGTVRVATAMPVPGVLRRFGCEPEEIFREAGLAPALFEDPDNRISFSDRSHLFKICRERTACEHFGLLLGQQSGLPSLGLVGYLVMNSPNVKSAINSLVHHFHLHSEGSLALLEVSEETAFLSYNIYHHVEAEEQLLDAAVAVILNILKQLCGSDWAPSGVSFAHRQPANKRPFTRFFNAPLRFNAEISGISFPPECLTRPVVGADQELFRLLEKQVSELEKTYSEDFPEQVRRIVNIALLANQASAEHIAAIFSIHSRTLHRRLKAHGVTFREISDECRFEIAARLLINSDTPLTEIADMLGYSDGRAFSRAFKRWSGVPPSQWRLSSGS